MTASLRCKIFFLITPQAASSGWWLGSSGVWGHQFKKEDMFGYKSLDKSERHMVSYTTRPVRDAEPYLVK